MLFEQNAFLILFILLILSKINQEVTFAATDNAA